MWFIAQKLKTGQEKKIYTSSAYLLCFANVGLKGMSLFLSRAKPRASQPQLFSFWVAWIWHSFVSYIPLSNVWIDQPFMPSNDVTMQKSGSNFDWFIVERSIRLEGMSEIQATMFSLIHGHSKAINSL